MCSLLAILPFCKRPGSGQSGHGQCWVPAPPTRTNTALPDRRAALSGVCRTPGRGRQTAARPCAAGIRWLPAMRASGARVPAPTLRLLPCRALAGIQLQAPRVLPKLRCSPDGRWGGLAGRSGVARAAHSTAQARATARLARSASSKGAKPSRVGISLPYPLRFLLATHPALMGRVLGIVHRVIAGHLIRQAGLTQQSARTGAVTLIQRR